MEDLHIMVGQMHGTLNAMKEGQIEGSARAKAAEQEMRELICDVAGNVAECQRQIVSLAHGVNDYRKVKKLAVRGMSLGALAVISSAWDYLKQHF